MKFDNHEWTKDVGDVQGSLGDLLGDEERGVGERSVLWAAKVLLGELRDELQRRAPAAPLVMPATVAALKPVTDTTGHRHSYDDTGRCKLNKPDGARCEVVSRASKKAAAAPVLPGAGGGSSS